MSCQCDSTCKSDIGCLGSLVLIVSLVSGVLAFIWVFGPGRDLWEWKERKADADAALEGRVRRLEVK